MHTMKIPVDRKWMVWAVLAILPLTACKNEDHSQERNVLFILVDDLGWKDLHCYGSDFYETPNIDDFSKEGVMFTNAYAAAPVCSPSRAGIMTGKYPARLHLTDWIPGRQANNNPGAHLCEELVPKPFQQFLPHEEKTIAEYLKDKGYQTFFAGKWHLGDEREYWPDQQGFDTNIGGYGQGYPNSYFSPYHNPALKDHEDGEYLTDRLTDETISFLESRDREKPFFAFLSFYAVHNPLQAKQDLVEKYREKANQTGLDRKEIFGLDPGWDEKDIACWNMKLRLVQSNAVYAAMIETVDNNFGKLIQTLKDLGLFDNTLIIFTSDNGGLSTAEGSNTSNLPLKDGKGWLYEGGTRVPLIMYEPVSRKTGVMDVPVMGIDFLPTINEFAGIATTREDIDGRSLMPLLDEQHYQGKSDLADRILFWHYPHYSNQGPQIGSSVLYENYKVIEDLENQEIELYHLPADTSEERNLAAEYPSKAGKLDSMLIHWRNVVNADMPAKK